MLAADGDPDPISAGTAGEAALWGGASAVVGMAANPFGAHQAGRVFAGRMPTPSVSRRWGVSAVRRLTGTPLWNFSTVPSGRLVAFLRWVPSNLKDSPYCPGRAMTDKLHSPLDRNEATSPSGRPMTALVQPRSSGYARD